MYVSPHTYMTSYTRLIPMRHTHADIHTCHFLAMYVSPHTYIHDVIHTSTTHASYTRVIFSVYLFRHEHAAAVRGVTHKSREGRGERSEPLHTSTTVQRMSGNLLLPLPRMMRRLGLGRAGYVSPDIHTIHTYHFLGMYVSPDIHTYQ